MWIMTTDFSELTPRQTRRVVRFTEPMFLTRSSPRADWRDAKLRGKTLFVVRHFVTLMAGTARACSAVFETCPPESDASTETADQIRRLISFPVPLELCFEETTISSFHPIFFLFHPFLFSFLTRLSKKAVF